MKIRKNSWKYILEIFSSRRNKLASSFCIGETSLKSFKLNSPVNATRSKIVQTRSVATKLSTFSALQRVHQAETSPVSEHEHHVQGKIFCYSTLYKDQNVLKQYDQHNPLYVYKATNDEILCIFTKPWQQKIGLKFWKAMQKLMTD